MSVGDPQRYEFTPPQNDLIGDLAAKMRLVGLVGVVIGVMNLISSLMLLVFIFRDKLRPDMLERIPEEVRSQLPPTAHLWGVFLQGVTGGLIFLLLGIWTRTSAASFQQVVDTTGRDISHLMNALASLRQMYSLLYTLIMIAVFFFLIALGVQLFGRFAG